MTNNDLTEKEQKDMEVYIAKLQATADRHGVALAEYEDLCAEWYDLHDGGWFVPAQDDWIQQTLADEAEIVEAEIIKITEGDA